MKIGARVEGGGTSFRVWAPGRRTVEVVIDGKAHALAREEDGYFSGTVKGVGDGTLYRYRLDGDGQFPDPASRHQPEGPHGPSRVVDPSRFAWTDAAWRGPTTKGAVLYEMHVGTFTREGTWAAAAERLPHLADVGVTIVEMMPVNEFAGRWGWGYDGVDLFAPAHVYGAPDDLRRFIDRAHALGLGVILDVVYNHLGPDGNYLAQYAAEYFSTRHKTDWGEAINFASRPVRDFFASNAAYWIDEYHFDGLRFDATQNIYDDGEGEHILAEMGKRAREAGRGRSVYLVAENEPQETRVVRTVAEKGYGFDALWNDDYHHSAVVALRGRREAYYRDYQGSPQEFISAARWGYLYQGQRYAWQNQRRGTPAFDIAPSSFVVFLENHDQVANSARGMRIHQLTSPGRHRAMTALTLLMPATPMLFQGQEWNSRSPFLYFADHQNELRGLVKKGRAEFLQQFPSLRCLELGDPADPEAFERCKLDWDAQDSCALALHKDLLALRRTLGRRVEGAVLREHAFALRWMEEPERLLIVNLGGDLALESIAEPLLAGPWQLVWSSEDAAYGGCGTPPPEDEDGRFYVLGESAVLLAPPPSKEVPR